MAINRLAISNASANTDTVLYTSVRNCLTSVIATNKSNSQSLIRIWIVPAGQSGDSTKWMHIAYDSIVTGNNSLETFRFPLENGDLVYVRADSANISFSISGIYENSGAQKVYYDSTAPGAPSIGDIWVNSGASYANTNTSAVIAYQAAEPTTKSPNLLWVDSSGNNTVFANQTGVNGPWGATSFVPYLSSDPLLFSTTGTERMRIDSAGKITFGTTAYGRLNPGNHAFDFASSGGWLLGSITTSGAYGGPISMLDGVAGWNIRLQDNGANMRFGYGTTTSGITEVLQLTNAGNIGIGTIAPNNTGRLSVVQSGQSTTAFFQNTNASWASDILNAYSPNGTDISNISFSARSDGTSWITSGFGPMIFRIGSANTTFTERMRIDANGYALIGYTSSNGAYRLQVNSQIFATSSTVATSDGRYKKNVNTISGGLDIIDSLRPVSFNWKEHVIHNFPEGKTIGFIAQEVKESLQDYDWVDNLVKTNYNEELDEEFLGIAEGNIIPLLVSAVKELKAEVEILKGQING